MAGRPATAETNPTSQPRSDYDDAPEQHERKTTQSAVHPPVASVPPKKRKKMFGSAQSEGAAPIATGTTITMPRSPYSQQSQQQSKKVGSESETRDTTGPTYTSPPSQHTPPLAAVQSVSATETRQPPRAQPAGSLTPQAGTQQTKPAPGNFTADEPFQLLPPPEGIDPGSIDDPTATYGRGGGQDPLVDAEEYWSWDAGKEKYVHWDEEEGKFIEYPDDFD
ncbi:hypothetical protein MKZ38_010412 [Zalerion maritima]|uniref:Uncharacterized protein n=1 Tax=Zalerion maritima TaxID=339359 RepID=A0AAD5RFP1_9PEZI|nr:hypothetical protein MKZ38_010412 [Zalerion maritima]